MTQRIHLVGIGLGDRAHLTGAGVAALDTLDVFVVLEPGAAAQRELLAAVLTDPGAHRFIEPTAHPSEPGSVGSPAAYGVGSVSERVTAIVRELGELAPPAATVGLLVPGVPALEAAAHELATALADRLGIGVAITPGVGAAQLLAARHGITLGRDGTGVHAISGQHLVDTYQPHDGDAVVVADAELRCLELAELYPDLEVFWGAHLDRDDEVLVSGRLGDLAATLTAARRRAEDASGWLLDAYVVRPSEPSSEVGPPPWPPVERLSDGVLGLRPLTASDWQTVLEENNDEESLRWSLTGPLTEAEARRRAASARRDWVSGRAARFVMVDEATGHPAGAIGVLRMGPPDIGLIGYGVLPRFRGRGFTTRALELLAEWAFSATSIVRLELGHKVGNVASGVVAARAGFVRESVLTGRLRNVDGTFSDEVTYARVRR
ncbi:GNAT family N-acetyltransferase [Intrasporangium calvum]|uniref:GCN5-related N-acetyltransferase n=1 Tax=Intrasporangium calvum (strain ATCC 23552 / DSM 43043 / JCM 3097 / NBRC 12989 / NCIMB 10167 / NRRL B-3866 / 7 KIP) TaxID=710696 RepID=E6S5Y4_INTC7|nr:GNAT family N-acetyltransferase [Intrasporangium calvum]ADU46724.1 GCN5-related N-acetyltransferase [Intrasporangium calvum DSM 43043]